MGAYLSEPKTEKVSSDEVGDSVIFGASSMQGWRISQEDAHNCCLNFDKDVSLFAVYDGHGGHEVAAYCAQNLPQFIKDTEAYKSGNIEQALKDAFLRFDATLAKPEVVAILKEIVGNSCGANQKGDIDDDSDEEENIRNLHIEADMPLDQVMAKYQSEVANPALKALKKEKDGKPASPYLRARRGGRDKASSSSSLAGCSSSSWHDNEADVSSSSSQTCGSTSVVAPETKPATDGIGSSEAEQVLDSTTSNGESVPGPPPEIVAAADSEPAKSIDMPDSSEDIKGLVSPSKTSVQVQQPTTNETDVNGAETKPEPQGADSSKGGGDNVTSSSCSLLENGEAEQQERISSSGRRRPVDYGLLSMNDGGSEDSDDEENDETFDGLPESDDEDDDTEDVDDIDDDDNEDDSDEDVEGDYDDEDDKYTMKMTEEPGSDSGCTAVVAVLAGRELYVANAGDSRCVLCRNGQAVELSLDHKPEDEPEMQRINKAGGKVTADGRVNGGLNLSRALGDHAYKQNMDLLPQEQMISAEPDIRKATINPEQDEFMVLACDGIWNFMSSQDVVQFVHTRLKQGYEKMSQICEELFDHCLAPNTLGDGTGCDNMTAVIVRFKKPSDATATATEASDPLTISMENKKRPASPIVAGDEGNISAEKDVATDAKRPKKEVLNKSM